MNSRNIILFLIVAFTLPSSAFALDMEYYTYDGYDTVVTGFQRLALIFSDDNYIGLFISFAILGIIFGGLALYLKGITGQQVSLLSWTLPIIVGVAIFQALLIPKGNVTVFDPVRNEFQVVAGVPDGVVAIAGILNMVERTVVDVVDTASAYPYADEAGGITFDLMTKATVSHLGIDDFLLTKTVGQYFKDCAPVAFNSPATAVSEQTIKRGTNDLRAQLALMNLGTVYTTVYNNANKWGISATCQDSWNLHINPFMGDATFATAEAALCSQIGFNSGSANQLISCRNLMQSAMEKYGIAVGTYGSTHFVRNIYLAQAIDRVMQDTNPDLAQRAIANRSLMAQGVGIQNTANEWLPQIRAIMFVVALGIIPLLALFVVTPLMGKVVMFTVGLFGWLTLWGITDAVMHQMAMDGAISFYERTTTYGFGLDSIWMTPEASTKATALFGKTKTYAIMIASVLAMALFKFGGYAFSQMAEGWARHIESAGSEAAMQTQTPEGRSHKMNEIEQSIAKESLRSNHSVDDMAMHSMVSTATGVQGTKSMLEAGASRGMTTSQIIDQMGTSQGYRESARVEALQDIAEMRGMNAEDPRQVAKLSAEFEKTRTMSFGSDMGATREAAKELGDGDELRGMAMYSHTDSASRYGQNATTRQIAEGMKESAMNTFNYDMSDSEAYQRIAEINSADLWATAKATGGDTDYLVDLYSKNKEMSLAENDSFFNSLAKNGLSPEHAGLTSGLFRGAEKFAQHEVSHDVGMNNIASGYYAEMASKGFKGSAIENAANMRNESVPEYLQSIENAGAVRSAAGLMKLDYIANTFDKSNEEAVLMQEGSNNVLTVSGMDNVERFLDKAGDTFTSTQQDFIRKHAETVGGVKIGYSLDLNDEKGQPFHTTITAGSEAYFSHSGKADSTHYTTSGESLSEDHIHKLFTNDLDPHTAKEEWKNLASTLDKDIDGEIGQKDILDSQVARNFFENTNKLFSTYGVDSATATDAQRMFASASVNAGFDSKDQLAGKLGSWATGLSAGGTTSTGGDGSSIDSENLTFNLGTYMMAGGFGIANELAERELAAKNININSENEVERKVAEEMRGEIVADKMTNLAQSTMSYLNSRGSEQFKDADSFGAVLKDWAESDGSFVPTTQEFNPDDHIEELKKSSYFESSIYKGSIDR